MKRNKGFTLVELLVVIAVIALLMSILMPVLRKAKDQAMRIMCGNHIKNQQLGMTMYADTHNNRIPSGGGYWPWDVPMDTVRALLRNMGTDMAALSGGRIPLQYSENFYCPANTPQKRYRANNWYYGGYIVGGFAYVWPADWNRSGRLDILGLGPGITGNALLKDPAKIWVDRIDIPQASERELIVDATLSQLRGNDPVKYPLGNFAMITVGGNPSGGTPNSTESSHY